jgi:hypothetical protein
MEAVSEVFLVMNMSEFYLWLAELGHMSYAQTPSCVTEYVFNMCIMW